MKFPLRRRDPEPEPVDAVAEPVPAPPRPPRGAAVGVYAEVLDGTTLWLAVEAAPGHLALLRAAPGPGDGGRPADPVVLHGDLVEDDPAYRTVRADLLPVTEEGAGYDLVLVPPGGRPPRPVWIAPDLDRGPVITPPSPGGESRFELTRTEDGTVRLTRRPVPPAHDLLTLSDAGAGIDLWIGDALPAGASGSAVDPLSGLDAELLLLGPDGPLARFPLTRDDGRWHATITRAGLPDGVAARTQVGVGTPEGWLPVRRRRNDLAGAGDAVLLPMLYGDLDDRPRMKLQWRRGGLLHARLIAQGTS